MAWRSKIAAAMLSAALASTAHAALFPQEYADSRWAPAAGEDKSVLQIPMEVGCGKAVFIRGKINGSGSLTFLIDSGGGSSYILDTSRAKSLGLEPNRRFNLEGGGEDYPVAFSAAGVPITLEGLTLRPSRIVMTDLAWLTSRCGMQIDGMIGYDLFRSYTVEINYSNKLLRLHNPNFRYEGSGHRLPLSEDRDHLLSVPARLEIPGEEAMEVNLVVDTGDALIPLAFTREFVEKHELLSKLEHRDAEGRIEGVGGKSHISLAQAKSLQLGNFVFRDLMIGLAQDRSGSLSGGNYDGVIGAAMLSKFDLIFDLAHGELILEANSIMAKPGKLSENQ